MSDFLIEIQKHEFTVLDKTLDVKVYDYIPDDENGIYCVIGDVEATTCFTKTFDGYEITSTIYVYAYEETMLNVKKQIGKIADILKTTRETVNGFFFEYHRINTISAKRIDLELIEGSIQIMYRLEEE